MDEPVIGVYRNSIGEAREVLCVATHAQTRGRFVVYRGESQETLIEPLEAWNEFIAPAYADAAPDDYSESYYAASPESSDAALMALRRVFGYDGFRGGQREAIDAITSGRDVMGVMPTGSGKSLCYQIPAIIMEGTALVVSPLISLMKDQVSALVQAGVAAAYINSSLSERQIEIALGRMARGEYRVVYVAPERLNSARFVEAARGLNLSVVAVDEAHCISQWGQDFRPSYLGIADFVRSLGARAPIAAFTATATPRVREDIERLLELRAPVCITTGFDRPNLFFEVLTPDKRKNALIDLVLTREGESGIVYCATRKAVEEVCEELIVNGVEATRYHAGLSDAERARNQEDFSYDRKRVMVATNAFGMGIDKSDVRFVIHFNMPKDLESYYQEAGRAGRDGLRADCYLLFSRRDIVTQRYFIDHMGEEAQLDSRAARELKLAAVSRLNRMIEYCETDGCLRGYILGYFGEKAPEKCGFCSNCAAPRAKAAKTASRARSRRKEGGELFDRLRAVRAQIASEKSVPAYVIFSDATLNEMCQKRPRTAEEMLDIQGVGRYKLSAYGDRFLQALNGADV